MSEATKHDNLNAREITHISRLAFLSAFRACGSVTDAAAAAGIDRATHYRWLHEDAEYEADFQKAKVLAAEGLEEEAVKRAKLGSDNLLMFLLRGYKGGVFRENWKGELSGPKGGPILHAPVDLTRLSMDQLKTLEQFAMEAMGAAGDTLVQEPLNDAKPSV